MKGILTVRSSVNKYMFPAGKSVTEFTRYIEERALENAIPTLKEKVNFEWKDGIFDQRVCEGKIVILSVGEYSNLLMKIEQLERERHTGGSFW